MDKAFVRGIGDPTRLQLQQLQETARKVVEERLADYRMTDVPDWVVRKLTYTYYHDWEADDPSYVFLLEDPGSPGEHVLMETEEYARLGPDYDVRDAVQVDRRFGARWLATRQYTDFSAEFVACCREQGLIDPGDPWWRYLLSGRFFDDFYMTDVVKYRGATPSSADVDQSFTAHLIDELEYVDPDLIFAFGKRAWETLRGRLGAEPVGDPPASQSVRDVHGALHATTRLLDTAILPVGHPSPNFRGAQIGHDEYMAGLEAGLERWRVTQSD